MRAVRCEVQPNLAPEIAEDLRKKIAELQGVKQEKLHHLKEKENRTKYKMLRFIGAQRALGNHHPRIHTASIR